MLPVESMEHHVARLRRAIATREALPEAARTLAFGVGAIDATLGGGLECAALHELAALPGHFAAAGLAAFTLVVPLSLLLGPGGLTAARFATAAAICACGLVAYCAGRTLTRWPKAAAWDLRLQAASVAAATTSHASSRSAGTNARRSATTGSASISG